MKKKRVFVQKALSQEKKQFFTALQQKATEIEKLKKLLLKRESELKRAGREREVAEMRAKEMQGKMKKLGGGGGGVGGVTASIST
ncbi:hypothetical protein EON64_20760, partial [archaeon]